MNDNMQQKMNAAWIEVKAREGKAVDAHSFDEGFTAAHDLLMPLLIEAMPHVMANEYWPDGQTSALVKRIREVIPIITKGETA